MGRTLACHRWEDLSPGSVCRVASPLSAQPRLQSLILEFTVLLRDRTSCLPGVDGLRSQAVGLREGAWGSHWVSELRQTLALHTPPPPLPWETWVCPVPEPSGGPRGGSASACHLVHGSAPISPVSIPTSVAAVCLLFIF